VTKTLNILECKHAYIVRIKDINSNTTNVSYDLNTMYKPSDWLH